MFFSHFREKFQTGDFYVFLAANVIVNKSPWPKFEPETTFWPWPRQDSNRRLPSGLTSPRFEPETSEWFWTKSSGPKLGWRPTEPSSVPVRHHWVEGLLLPGRDPAAAGGLGAVGPLASDASHVDGTQSVTSFLLHVNKCFASCPIFWFWNFNYWKSIDEIKLKCLILAIHLGA